ncbi:MAG: hypothetical protein JWS10_206 [Cypionkella sp.]|nr:hypothetical protein [Cypionkella sp.]
MDAFRLTVIAFAVNCLVGIGIEMLLRGGLKQLS